MIENTCLRLSIPIKSWYLNSRLVIVIVIIFFIISVLAYIWNNKNNFILLEIRLINFSFLPISIIFLLDQWSLTFFLTVLLISLSVFIFRGSYILLDKNFLRFHLILWLFVVSMLLLIFSPGLFSLILGWDGLGLRSFLLVIYYKNYKSMNAGILTFLTNRLGDGLMLTGILFAVMVNRFNIYTAELNSFSNRIFYLLIFGAITKSAQIPFRAWLPAAMAAPTPVSSLVHSSTLVTAGIYIVFRISDFLSQNTYYILLSLGTLTILIARIRALTETDIKKIVALSTLRQLGLIIVALGRGQPLLRFFHLITHAFFKAIIFVGVGVIIHSSVRYQDFKVIGHSALTPIVLGIISGANLSLCGLPFFSGFFRKEIILQRSSLIINRSLVFSGLFILRIILTQVYRIRFIAKVFLFSSNFPTRKNFCEIDLRSFYAIILLFVPACFTGRYIRSFLKINFDFFIDPRFLKTLICLIFIIRIIARICLIKSNLSFPYIIFMFNMWLLPVFSGIFFSKRFFSRDKNYKIFLTYMVERLALYTGKVISLRILNKIKREGDMILKFSVIIGAFFLIIHLYQRVYLNVKNISN